MCFSAPASFTASALLGIIGHATVQKVTQKSQYPFAMVPLLFALQQFCEGVLWLTFAYPSIASLHRPSMYGFLFFAYGIWPLWMPLSVWLLEPNNNKRTLFYAFTTLGALLSATLLFALTHYSITATIDFNHIMYEIDAPIQIQLLAMIIYLITTIIPFLCSNFTMVKLFGTLIALSYACAYIFYFSTLTSVWCFFAAVLSAGVWFVINQQPEHN